MFRLACSLVVLFFLSLVAQVDAQITSYENGIDRTVRTPVLQIATPLTMTADGNCFQPSPIVQTVFQPQPFRLATEEAAHTPMSEVVRVIGLLPKPEIAFVDFGCGYDARWCVAAAEHWGCKCIGIEINSDRANAARDRVRNLGLDHLITILEGDAGEVSVSGDVAVVYLYPSLLARLKPRLQGFKAFASYLHQVPGMNCTKNGDTWFYRRQVQLTAVSRSAVWGGSAYNQPVCTSRNCAMCNSIRQQLGY